MERTCWLSALLLLSLAVPPAVADQLADTLAGLCVDLEGPTVKYDECGPRVGVVLTLATDTGTYSYRLGCQEDCAKTIYVTLCAHFHFPPIYDMEGNFVEDTEAAVEDEVRHLATMFDDTGPARFVNAQLGAEPARPCVPGLPAA